MIRSARLPSASRAPQFRVLQAERFPDLFHEVPSGSCRHDEPHNGNGMASLCFRIRLHGEGGSPQRVAIDVNSRKAVEKNLRHGKGFVGRGLCFRHLPAFLCLNRGTLTQKLPLYLSQNLQCILWLWSGTNSHLDSRNMKARPFVRCAT
jgi:hypothetical protein